MVRSCEAFYLPTEKLFHLMHASVHTYSRIAFGVLRLHSDSFHTTVKSAQAIRVLACGAGDHKFKHHQNQRSELEIPSWLQWYYVDRLRYCTFSGLQWSLCDGIIGVVLLGPQWSANIC